MCSHRLVLAASLVFASGAAASELSTIRLGTGEELRVAVTDITPDGVTFDHPLLGSTTLSRDQVTIVGLDDLQPAMVLTQDDDAEAEVAEEAAAPWKWSALIGASYVDGNTEEASVNASLAVRRETEEERTQLSASYYYSESNKVRSDNKTAVKGRHDWLLPGSKWFWFADLGWDYDSFKGWDHRLNGHIGPGYNLVKKDDYFLDLLAGIGFVKEWGSDNDDWRPEALIGFDGAWQITEKQSLEFDAFYYPDLDDTGEFRSTASAAWKVLLDEEMNMSLALGVEWEHESKVDPGTRKNDTRVILGLQFDW